MSFDQIEARINQAVMKKLANAVANIAGVDVPVIFDAQYTLAGVGPVGMASSSPQMVLSNSDIPADFIESQVDVKGTRYTVVETKPDSLLPSGLTIVLLERA
jgi:hypothetical protein